VTVALGRQPYSPRLRTALVLSGTGTLGAYHAGVLRALREAGVKIDLVAGRGIGVVGALFGSVDGGARLWAADGFWHSREVARFYRWRTTLRVLAWTLWAALSLTLAPILVLASGLLVYSFSFLLALVHLRAGADLADKYSALVRSAFEAGGLPTIVPQIIVVFCGALLVQLVLASRRAALRSGRRKARGAFWWRVVGAPLSSREVIAFWRGALWRLMTGGTKVAQPTSLDLSRRYSELLTEGLGQPGFREFLAVVHDLDARRDMVVALLAESHRAAFFGRGPGGAWAQRAAETLDLAGVGRDHGMDALAAALSIPVVGEPWPVTFAAENYWRGETHRLCDRPEALARLLEEVQQAGVEQVIVVLPGPALDSPHALSPSRLEGRSRLGEWLSAAEIASSRDAVGARRDTFRNLFVIGPEHNPVGPFDFTGAYDERSDRVVGLSELVDRGYEDAYRQFIEPEVGAGGDDLKP
jgi:hypothetical protein